jgi:hypothetical protein
VSAVILAPDSAALTPARAELARIDAQIAAAAAERDEAQRFIAQWRGPSSEMATVELQLSQLRAQRDSDRAAWNDGGCLGEPPGDPPDLLILERTRARLRERLGGNEGALQAAAETAERAQERFATLSLQKKSVHLRAVIEAARERIDDHAVPAIIASINELGSVQNIARVLADRVDDPESVAASREIDMLVLVARRSWGVRGDLEAAHRFLEELAGDPAAQIPDPGPPIVERCDPGIPRGAGEEGAKPYINLAVPPERPVSQGSGVVGFQ